MRKSSIGTNHSRKSISQWLRPPYRTTKTRQIDLTELSGRAKDCGSFRQAANNAFQDPGSHYKTRRADCVSGHTRSTPARLRIKPAHDGCRAGCIARGRPGLL